MPAYSASQISKPLDGQDFERSCRVLWKCLLDDPNVMENGRSGQKQAGVDLWGYRRQDTGQLVGIQCKLKAEGIKLKASEVRTEIALALKFAPPLKEFFIVTTAPDDVELQEIARLATATQKDSGRDIAIHVWGWGAMQERIAEHLDAARAFDPSFGVFGQALLAGQADVLASNVGIHDQLASMTAMLAQLAGAGGIVQATLGRSAAPDDATPGASAAEQALDAQIDEYRDVMAAGQPRTALGLLERLLVRIGDTASGRIVFRIKANAGFCRFLLNDVTKGAELLIEAHDHAPYEPKAVAIKAYGLLLLDRFEEVLELGRANLTEDPVYETLAGFVIMAAMRIPGIDDPVSLVPASLLLLPNVEAATVDVLRMRGIVPRWWEAARGALERHPNHDRLPIHVAEADLDEVTRSADFLASGMLDDGQRAKVRAVAKVMRDAWDEARSGERVVRPEMAALCCNTAAALHLVEESAAARVVVEQGLEACPGDKDLLLRAAQLAVDAGFEDLANRVLPLIGHEPAAQLFRFIHASHVGDWKTVMDIGEGDIDAIPEAERNMVATATRLAPFKLGLEEVTPGRLQTILDEAGDARSAVVFAEVARQLNEEGLAGAALEKAIALIRDTSHASSKKMVALHAARAGRWDVVSDLLDGTISLEHDTHELRWLAAAYSSEMPVRQAAITFFAALDPVVLAHPYFTRAAALMNYNRGELDAARDWSERLIALQPTCAFARLLHLMTMHRKGDLDAVRTSVSKLDIDAIEGEPLERLNLARFMTSFGRTDDALAYGYSIYQANRNDAQVAARFAGTVIAAGQLGAAYHPSTVQPGCWVRLSEAGGDACEFVIAQSGERPTEAVFGPTHPFAAGATGLAVGGTFPQELQFGRTREWTVESYQHRILRAAGDIIDNFELRFPGEPGFHKFSVDPEYGIPREIIETSRRQEEGRRKAADLYASRLLPIALLAHQIGSDPITFGHQLQAFDVDINASLGSIEEWEAGLAIARRASRRGIVLDAYTTWVATEAGLLDILRSLTKRVVVPRSVIDYAEIVAGGDDGPGELKGTFGHRNGKPMLTLVTASDIEERKRQMAAMMGEIRSGTDIVAVAVPGRPSKTARHITENWGTHSLDPAYVAVAEDMILVSDDVVYRKFASEACGAPGTWLHVLLALAFSRNVIDLPRYAKAVVALAIRRHNHVFLDTPTMIEVLRQDETDELREFEAVTLYVGIASADLPSHIRCTALFLMTLWRGTVPWQRRARATHLLLSSLVRHLTVQRASALSELRLMLSDDEPLSNYLNWWSWLHRSATPTGSVILPLSRQAA